MKTSRAVAGWALAGAFCASSVAFGQGKDPAAADALFQRGMESLKANDWDSACKAFDASMKLDPSVGTQINLARCAEHNGQVARAWADFRKAKALNAETPLAKRKANVESYVDAEIKKLEGRLPWVTVKLRSARPDGADAKPLVPSSIPGLKLERDDAVVPLEGLGVSVPIDPGMHVFRASAPGYRDATIQLNFVEGGKQEAVLTMVVAPASEKPPVVPPPGGAPLPRPTPAVEDEGMGPLFWAGIAIGAVGAGGLIVAGVTGGIAQADRDTLDELVDSGNCSEANGVLECDTANKANAHNAISRGESLSLVSTVTLFAGAGLAATGLVLAVVGATSTSEKAPAVGFAPLLSRDLVGGVVGGSF
jgi:hypothetical protein